MQTEQQNIIENPPVIEKQNNSKLQRIERLKPFRFKKGVVSNPKGRPKSILSKHEKLQLLSEYARMNPKKVNPVEAIREINKMEGDYAPEKHAVVGDIIIEVVYKDKLIEGKNV